MKPEEDSNEDGEAGEKDEEPDEPQPEVGPPLLSPLSHDAGQSLTPNFFTFRLMNQTYVLERNLCF